MSQSSFNFSDHITRILKEVAACTGMTQKDIVVSGILIIAEREARRIKQWQEMERKHGYIENE
jgi:hypothetical protein